MGVQHALVVWGKDGTDEISLGDATMVGELRAGKVSEYEVHPRDFGLDTAAVDQLQVQSAQESKAMVLKALDGSASAARDIVLLNTGAALYAADVAESIGEGIEKARATLTSGQAREKLDQFVAATRRISGR
jgi:anthranilate phosphoribosyltransferase